jgi:hypothetical protein
MHLASKVNNILYFIYYNIVQWLLFQKAYIQAVLPENVVLVLYTYQQ